MCTLCNPLQESLLSTEKGYNLAGVAVVYAANGDSQGLAFHYWAQPLNCTVTDPVSSVAGKAYLSGTVSDTSVSFGNMQFQAVDTPLVRTGYLEMHPA